eukprot:scaffold297251_cov26-Tisochrysis_lutea.AAC.10
MPLLCGRRNAKKPHAAALPERQPTGTSGQNTSHPSYSAQCSTRMRASRQVRALCSQGGCRGRRR